MMENRENRNPTGQESDISKSQSQQQPAAENEQFETGQQQNSPELDQSRQAGQPDEGLQGETATQQRTDVEGASTESEDEEEIDIGFVGSQGDRDTSGKLIDEQGFEKGGQGAPDGK